MSCGGSRSRQRSRRTGSCSHCPTDVRRRPRVQIGSYRRTGETEREPIYMDSERDLRLHANQLPFGGDEWFAEMQVELQADSVRIEAAERAAGLTAVRDLSDRLVDDALEVEDELFATKATSIAGLIAQVQVLRESVEGQREEPLADVVIARLQEMAGGVA